MYTSIIEQLSKNTDVFEALVSGLSEEQHLWRPEPDKWCLLEIICHLYDEEREDFRARLQLSLFDPDGSHTPIDPSGWVRSRQYMQQDFDEMHTLFLEERKNSVKWLNALKDPDWESAFMHPSLGRMTAKMFLCNWLAHDYLHIRQILQLKYHYLQWYSKESLGYAGNWPGIG